ncbi:MAG: hypothetical protein K2N34_15145 [Lachnospiraceae bacterium]|nr:hypothetical protein [Lachnospiraceae bacterium]
MIKFAEKVVQKVQLNDISMEYICSFYKDESFYNTVLMIYDGNRYFTNIGYEEVCRYSEEKELMYFMKYLCKGKSIQFSDNMLDKAGKIFKKNPSFIYIMVEDSYKDGKAAFCFDNMLDITESSKAMEAVCSRLRDEGVFSYLVAIPDYEDILIENRHSEWKLGSFSKKINWALPNRPVMEKYLSQFTDLKYDTARRCMLQPKRLNICKGAEQRTIFLVGFCIVQGWGNFSGETLVDILYEKLVCRGFKYQVKKVDVYARHSTWSVETILEFDIKKNDIVILINCGMCKSSADLDLTDVYNRYHGDKWIYSDIPIHTTKTGNEIIVDTIIENIIEPVFRNSREINDQIVVHTGEKMLTYDEKSAVDRYLMDIKKSDNDSYQVIGACVMTCNPFTKGHCYLVEYASALVDLLYVFVVEEDEFYFSFKDRIEMVWRGTAHLNNVVVVPSGKFIISKETFKNYFEKEVYTDVVIDAEKDIAFFKKCIAPALGITKRFVGEEPEDYVTAQYNRLLKEQMAGEIEVIEIPRKEIDGEVISASNVRWYLEKRDWRGMEKLIPHTTLEYIKTNHKEHENSQNKNKLSDRFIRVLQFIQSHRNVVICGLGEVAKELIWQLDLNMDIANIDALEFYDEEMAQRYSGFRGKKILNFNELISEYKNYYMVIATKRFKVDLFYDLTQNGVDPRHIIVFNEII